MVLNFVFSGPRMKISDCEKLFWIISAPQMELLRLRINKNVLLQVYVVCFNFRSLSCLPRKKVSQEEFCNIDFPFGISSEHGSEKNSCERQLFGAVAQSFVIELCVENFLQHWTKLKDNSKPNLITTRKQKI